VIDLLSVVFVPVERAPLVDERLLVELVADL